MWKFADKGPAFAQPHCHGFDLKVEKRHAQEPLRQRHVTSVSRADKLPADMRDDCSFR